MMLKYYHLIFYYFLYCIPFALMFEKLNIQGKRSNFWLIALQVKLFIFKQFSFSIILKNF